MTENAVGEVRPSQLLWTYGPGALVDLPHLSAVTMGLEYWEKSRCEPVEERRLLEAVQRVLGAQVGSLRVPPVQTEENLDPLSPEARIGVPVRPFPRWLRCVKCGLLSPFDSGLFEVKPNAYRPDRTRFVHQGCRGSKGTDRSRDVDAVPSRFLLACRNGHLDDFPWHFFVHGGRSPCGGSLRFFEDGASLQTENLWVRCDDCGLAKSMARAFGKSGVESLPSCRGRHVHLGDYDPTCDERPRAVLLGATNGWFPISLSVLAIPPEDRSIGGIIDAGWEDFKEVEDEAELKGVVKTLTRRDAIPGLASQGISELWAEIEKRRSGTAVGAVVTESDIKTPEWRVLTSPSPRSDWPHFYSRAVAAPTGYSSSINGVLLLERLREVNALIGFTRVEPPEESDESSEGPTRAALSKEAPDWVPANQVHGEGIFIRFDEARVSTWAERSAVRSLDTNMLMGHTGWRNARKLNPSEGYPGIRYTMLHTLAHLLIRELALECGYNAASIRERIYATDSDAEEPQAGILVYTAAADSDGTLGGLVELGHPANMSRLLDQALERARICSSDPLCAEHDPGRDRSLHGASCHACSFVSETSCERGNRYLDRALLIPTLDCPDAAFFIDE